MRSVSNTHNTVCPIDSLSTCKNLVKLLLCDHRFVHLNLFCLEQCMEKPID